MGIKKRFQTRYLTAILAAVLLIPAMYLAKWAGDHPGNESTWQLGLFSLLLAGGLLCIVSCHFTNETIIALSSHLGVRSLRPYLELSDSEMEDLCLKRLQVLADELSRVQHDFPMPLSSERMDASRRFRRAYWFFEEHKFIKPTKWDAFFPEPETQK